MLRTLKHIVKYRLLDGWAQKSYAQEAEDLILSRYFGNQKFGFYVDVGAHHPKRFSNTYYFYKRGWRGINIDAMPGSMALFRQLRSRDINLEVAVGSEEQILPYYIFNEAALNSFDRNLSNERNNAENDYRIIETDNLQTRQLASILDEYLPIGQDISFLSVDVEGLDFDVLKSNDWDKHRPDILLVEILGSSLADLESSEITRFLKKCGYEVYAKAVHPVIFRKVVY